MSRAEDLPPGSDRSGPWRGVAAVCIAVEAVALALGGLWAIVVVARGSADSIAVALSLAGFALVLAVVLWFASRAVRTGRGRVRGPVLTWQLLQAATAGTLIGGAGAATPIAARIGFWVAALLAVVVVTALLVDAARRES